MRGEQQGGLVPVCTILSQIRSEWPSGHQVRRDKFHWKPKFIHRRASSIFLYEFNDSAESFQLKARLIDDFKILTIQNEVMYIEKNRTINLTLSFPSIKGIRQDSV